ncbi:zinc finger protein 836-like isoform X1 [Saccostrea echinata]|uniref:zinc finger protein 836-like isoform X1 n=1 Tax=Saccostrea echinata TaxID=191078 RepID=UPI002A816FEE|nr:zinc finger protein 836-like isoform X1 [Saccostrea echinata]
MEESISTVKMEDPGGGRGNLSFGMPSMSGEPVVITYTTENAEDAIQIQEKTPPKTDETQDRPCTESSNQETESIESDNFTEALAGEQLLQMANAIVLEQGQVEGVENQQEIIQTVDENGTIVSEMQIVQNDSQVEAMEDLQTMAEYTDEDGAIHQVPVKLDKNNQQLVQLLPVSTEDGNQVYIQVLSSAKPDSHPSTESQTEIHEIMISEDQLEPEMLSQESMANEEVTVENVQEMANYKSEVLEDGTVQIYMLEDKNTEKKGMNKTLMNIISPTKQDAPSPPTSSLMTIQAKKYRDVATQITVFPKFSRQGLYDVSTQVTAKEILRDPKLRSLPNGTTVIQNSIVSQSESTIILNSGSENEMILHKCTICGKVYKNKLNWQGHIKIHAQEKVYMCGYCGKIYPRSSLSTHLRTHSELRQIAVFENLPDHLKRKNYKQAPGMVFPNEEASIIELSIADVATEIDPDLFPPPAAEVVTAPANIVTSNDASLPEPAAESEVFTENEIPAKMHMEVEAEAEIQEGTKTKFIYKCNVCGKEYNNKSNCHRHLKSHTDTKGFKCGYCGKAFTHRYEVRMHCRTHTGERPYKCPICTRGFNESGNLRRHMKIHEGDNSPFKCGVCFKGFNDTLRLNAHMKVHTGEIVCDVCGKKFGKISDLYRHIKIHSGDRPYKCDLCGKTFCQKVNLVTHQRTHTGQKAFRCDFCGLGFSRKTILQQHMKTHMEDEEFSVERTEVRPVRGEVEIMEADVIEHMEALSNEFVEDGETQTTDIQSVVLEDGEEVITEATSQEIATYTE